MFKKLIERIRKYKTVGVFSHVRPDGDCIGSQVALCRWLQKNGHEAFAFNDDEVPDYLQFLTGYYPVQRPDEATVAACDLFIVVDGNTPHRFGRYQQWREQLGTPSLMIDHHPEPDPVFDESVSVEDASSTCELIFRLFEEHDISQLDSDTAKAIYTGILTDTGSLQFDSVKPETLEAVATLLRLGKFKPNEIAEKVFSNQTLEQLKLLSKAMATIQLFENNQIAVMSVTKQMLTETDTTNADTGGFVNYPLSIAGVKAAILLKDLDHDGIKMSLRSKSDVDVNRWARELGGGGHKKASGAWHEGPLDKAIEETVAIGAKLLKELEHESVS
ncbi:MAG: DHH family phosphoesterase [Balneolaceae bacterium]